MAYTDHFTSNKNVPFKKICSCIACQNTNRNLGEHGQLREFIPYGNAFYARNGGKYNLSHSSKKHPTKFTETTMGLLPGQGAWPASIPGLSERLRVRHPVWGIQPRWDKGPPVFPAAGSNSSGILLVPNRGLLYEVKQIRCQWAQKTWELSLCCSFLVSPERWGRELQAQMRISQ